MDVGTSAHAAALWVGLHLILLLTLSVLAVRQRRTHRVALGDEGIPELAQALRAFGNASEYIPAGLVGIGVLALVEAPPLLIHIAGFVLLAGRTVHAIGLSRSGGASVARACGIVLTWLAYVFASAALLFYAIS